MKMSTKLDIRTRIKLILLALVLIALGLYIFNDEIKEHKVTKAKMEMFKRMLKTQPNEWDEEFKEVYDSMIVEKKDSSEIFLEKGLIFYKC